MRKILSVSLLICVMLSVFVSGCATKTEEPTEYIGLISAIINFAILGEKELKVYIPAMSRFCLTR